MWLLHARTRKLQYFRSEEEVPGGFAILSHTWGDEEVAFEEIDSPAATRKEGYVKIEYVCDQALKDGYTYAWVDTCTSHICKHKLLIITSSAEIGCIDKRSSAELSEAINSMFRWYSAAGICYAHLSDVDATHSNELITEGQILDEPNEFCVSRWFTRGWTLQELIAPREVIFYDNAWRDMAQKSAIIGALSQITGIDEGVLKDRRQLAGISIAQRMSWAANRRTSRIEDWAYSLLGIFDINMPMLYGEGWRAFRRLQEEIIKTSTVADHSILAWVPSAADSIWATQGSQRDCLLAPSPQAFRHAGDIVSWSLPHNETFELSQRGLRLTAAVRRAYPDSPEDYEDNGYLVALNCAYKRRGSKRIILRLVRKIRIEEVDLPDPVQPGGGLLKEELFCYRYLVDQFATNALESVDFRNTWGWEKMTLTMTRDRLVFPEHGDAVYIEANPQNSPPRHELRDFLALEGGAEHRGFRGGLVISSRMHPERRFETRLDLFVLPLIDSSRPPRLVIQLDSDEGPKRLEFLGGERLVDHVIGPGNLRVAARYRSVVGDLLWSIKFTAPHHLEWKRG